MRVPAPPHGQVDMHPPGHQAHSVQTLSLQDTQQARVQARRQRRRHLPRPDLLPVPGPRVRRHRARAAQRKVQGAGGPRDSQLGHGAPGEATVHHKQEHPLAAHLRNL